jgi:hypothetical protein
MRRVSSALVALGLIVAGVTPRAQAPERHFLWSITPAEGPPTYLVGSLHVLTAQHYPLSPRLERAFSESTVLVEEVDIDEMTNPATSLSLIGKAMYVDGTTLDRVIAPDLFKSVVARAEKTGVPIPAIQRMKPWMAAVSLTAPALKAAGFEASRGVDQHFFDKAKLAGMERRALETVAYQFDRLDQMPAATQEAMLRSVIADLDLQLSSVKEIADAWARGDTATIERLLLGALLESPDLYERLLVERNRNWVAPVEACILAKTACFVVVGAAHLVGPHSLVSLLEKRGHRVTQQ